MQLKAKARSPKTYAGFKIITASQFFLEPNQKRALSSSTVNKFLYFFITYFFLYEELTVLDKSYSVEDRNNGKLILFISKKTRN